MTNTRNKTRCGWESRDPLMIRYHDEEWGVALHNDRKLFEFLVLDTFQAGLSWAIILNKRENFRRAFDQFDPYRIARYSEDKIESLITDKSIIRNRAKIQAAVNNAQMYLNILETFDSFDQYIWQFVKGQPIVNRWSSLTEIPVSTRESDAMSKDLKKRGFKFVGTTICYAFMQAAGLVNDHLVSCFRYNEINDLHK